MTTIAINPSLVNRGEKTPENRHYSRVRLTPRGRFITRLAVIASLSILLLSGFAAVTGASAGSTDTAIPTPYVKVSVKPGDTLIRIGMDNGQSGRDIARWNQIDNPNVIEVGQVLRVRPEATAARVAARPSERAADRASDRAADRPAERSGGAAGGGVAAGRRHRAKLEVTGHAPSNTEPV